jgi:hypothetical protein
MAAKALGALIPLRAVPLKATFLLSSLNEYFSSNSAVKEIFASPTLSHNEMHGAFCLCFEILDGLWRRMQGVGDNKELFMVLQVNSGTIDRQPI